MVLESLVVVLELYQDLNVGGDGYEQLNVIGLSRYSRKYKKSVIRRNLITNFRIKKIYSPTILRIMKETEDNDCHCEWWDNTEESYQQIIELANRLNSKKADQSTFLCGK